MTLDQDVAGLVAAPVPFMRSAEVRWLSEGDLPPSMADWFRHSAFCGAPEQRTDEYLRLDGSSTVGIKIRSGRLEVKWLCLPPGEIRFSHGPAGVLEFWIKQSFAGETVAPFVRTLHVSSGVVAVRKTRWLRKISMDEGEPVEVTPETQPQQGCNAELTALELGSSRWWSVAFEGFGPTASIEDNLRRSAERFLAVTTPPVRLSRTESLSYPAWLAKAGPAVMA